MRVNVYSQELTPEVKLIRKNGFAGVAFILSSSKMLHNRPNDDDRSAVIFWVNDDGKTMDRRQFAEILRKAADSLEQMRKVETS